MNEDRQNTNFENNDEILDEYQDDILDTEEARNKYRISIVSFFFFFLITQFTAAIVMITLRSLGLLSYSGLLNFLIISISMIPIYFFMGKKALRETRSSRPDNYLNIKDIIFFLGIMFGLTTLFNIFSQFIMNIFNITSVDVTAQIQESLNFDLFIYVVLIGPLLEEIHFRRFHLNNTRKYGAYASILLSSLIFAFAHMNFLQGIGTLGIGMVLGYVAYFYSFRDAVILHILNNLIVAVLGFITSKFYESSELILSIIGLFMMSLALFSIISLFGKYRKNRLKTNLKFDEKEKTYLKSLLTDPVFIIFITLTILFISNIDKILELTNG